jgi:hypothetical protein
MLRRGLTSGLVLWLSAAAATAAQVSASFTVGVVIGGKAGHRPQRIAPRKTYTWGAAEISVRRAGFASPQRTGKSDLIYWFTAEKAGASYRIAVAIDSGRIVEVVPA